MKIGMISHYLPSGSKIGAGYQAHYMANAMVRRGHQVTMHSLCGPSEGALYDIVEIPVRASLRTFRFAWELRHVDWSSFDVVHAHGDDYWLWTRRSAQLPPLVRTMHGSCLSEAFHIPGWKEKVRMAALGLSEVVAALTVDATVAVSNNTRRDYPWIRRMIPNGVDLETFRPAAEKEEHPTILFVGTYLNRKRGKLLMEEFSEKVLPAFPDARLWMVCSDAPEARGVTVFGRVNGEKLAELYRKAWIFCLPSSYEGFGVPYIEAMASGTPVIATPNPGAIEVLEKGKYGVLADPGELGREIVGLLQQPERRKELEKLGLERAQEYGWGRIASRYEHLYQELATRKKRGARAASDLNGIHSGGTPRAEAVESRS